MSKEVGAMTEQRLGQLAAEYVAAWNTHDVEKATAFYVEDGTYEDLGLGSVARGHGEIRRYFADAFSAFPDVHIELDGEPAIRGNRVFAEWVMSGTHKGEFAGMPASGKRFEVQGVSAIVTRGDKILRNRDYFDLLTVMKQLSAQS